MTLQTEQQQVAQLACLRGLQAAFAKEGILNVTEAQLRDRKHCIQNFLVAVRNGAEDYNGAVFEHVYYIMEGHYHFLGGAGNPATDFEYKVFDLGNTTSSTVLAFIADCNNPREVVDFVDRLLEDVPAAPAI